VGVTIYVTVSIMMGINTYYYLRVVDKTRIKNIEPGQPHPSPTVRWL